MFYVNCMMNHATVDVDDPVRLEVIVKLVPTEVAVTATNSVTGVAAFCIVNKIRHDAVTCVVVTVAVPATSATVPAEFSPMVCATAKFCAMAALLRDDVMPVPPMIVE